MPLAPVEDEGVTGVRGDLDGPLRVRVVHAQVSRAGQRVPQVAARDHLRRAPAGLGQVGEHVPDLEREHRPRYLRVQRLRVGVLPVPVLVPTPVRLLRLLRRGRHVEVVVVGVDVPAGQAPHVGERDRVGEQLAEQFIAGQEAQQVQGAVRLDVALGLFFRVHPVDRRNERGAVVLGQDVAQE